MIRVILSQQLGWDLPIPSHLISQPKAPKDLSAHGTERTPVVREISSHSHHLDSASFTQVPRRTPLQHCPPKPQHKYQHPAKSACVSHHLTPLHYSALAPPIPMEASHSHGHQSPPAPSSSETLMAALLHVPAAQLPSLARSLAADARRLRCRLAFLLLSPPHFARALARLRAMPLRAKAALLGRVLLRSLLLLLPALCPDNYGGDGGGQHHLLLQEPDLDAALLLLAMCDSYSPAAAASPSPVDWRAVIVDDVVASALSASGLGATPWAALAPTSTRPPSAAASPTSCRLTAAARSAKAEGAGPPRTRPCWRCPPRPGTARRAPYAGRSWPAAAAASACARCGRAGTGSTGAARCGGWRGATPARAAAPSCPRRTPPRRRGGCGGPWRGWRAAGEAYVVDRSLDRWDALPLVAFARRGTWFRALVTDSFGRRRWLLGWRWGPGRLGTYGIMMWNDFCEINKLRRTCMGLSLANCLSYRISIMRRANDLDSFVLLSVGQWSSRGEIEEQDRYRRFAA
ncbi:hypothetical protein SETIT_3G245800v2 [Setaria italica]|uniref:Uncharacterized protein n=1 Tax=Setaria italica TaxID=4555 RepID=A0A368QIQ3_SETIT|nr:hypothetical protein SETIT_3G245800v2 [Setaria italica]